ncbi:MAG: hypothetical protein LQ338_007071 [Usnochroma carphineum]|nr:MAG: hypothetical protein LQ338_007071 [Usnochroma carphineum]
MALDAATAKEMIEKLAEDRAKYLDTLSRAHDVLAKALEASATGKPPPKLTSEAVQRNSTEVIRRNTANTIDVESLKKSSTFSPEDSDTDDNESMFVQEPLPKEEYDEAGLKKHIREYQWTPHDKEIVGSVLDKEQLLRRTNIFPVTTGPVDDRSHLSHCSIFDVGNDGAPLEIHRADEKHVSRAQTIWNNIKAINPDESRSRQAVGRITIVREPSALLFAALHYTQNSHFDMDEIFAMLVEDKTKAEAHRAFSHDHRHQRTFVFTLDFFTIIGEDCKPETWQRSDEEGGTPETHVPLSRCSSVVALSLSGPPARQVRNKARRAEQKTGYIFDPFAPWRVLSIQSYPDWKHSIDAHNSTRHYVNGPEAFLITLRAEFKDAQKRLMEVYNRISDLVRMPPNFMFSRAARARLLFEDDQFTFSHRYFWAHQSLGIMNEDIQEMILAYRKVFTEHVWDGSSKIVWPGDESVSSRYANWRKRMKYLRADIENELRGLEEIANMNTEKMKEIKGLRDNLFSGTSVLESRKSVDAANITVQQGHNIKLLTLVTIFFLPLTFVTSVFGMTNMDPNQSFHPFGIVTAVICIPTYMLIGSLNTTSGVEFWRGKTRQFFSFIGGMITNFFLYFGYTPEWAQQPSIPQPGPSAVRPLQTRSQSAREGLIARGNIPGVVTSPTTPTTAFNRRPTLSPSSTRQYSSQNNLPRMLTHASTVRFDDEKHDPDDDTRPKHLIRKLDHGDHRGTSSWGTLNGHHQHGVSALDHAQHRQQTFLHGAPVMASPTSLRRNETYASNEERGSEGWLKRVWTWGSGSTKNKAKSGEREV